MTLNPAPPLSVMSCLLVIINEKQVKVSAVPQRRVVPVVTTTNKTSLDHTCGSTMPYWWEANVAWFRDLMVVQDVPAFSDNIEATRRRDASQLWVITRPRDHELLGVLWMVLKIWPWEKQTNMTTSDEWKSDEIRHRRMANWLQLLSEEEETKNQGSLRNCGSQMLRGAIQMSESEPPKKVACKWNSRQRTFPPKKINLKKKLQVCFSCPTFMFTRVTSRRRSWQSCSEATLLVQERSKLNLLL